MTSSGQAKVQEHAQVDPAKAQAREMLRTLCKFLLPVIQSASCQTKDPNDVLFGIEADEFVTELKDFISGIILRSQPRNQDIAIDATLGKELFSPSEEDEATMRASSNDKEDIEHIPMNQSMIPCPAVPPSVPLDATEKDLGEKLQDLRAHVMQNMPIRLLCFEPHRSNLKISLFERADVYNYLALKLRADFDGTPISSWIYKRARYAILSHTWNQMPGELTYGDWKNGLLDATQAKCHKLVNFCKAAWENHKLSLGWIDTVCINKESSAELDESIRSMYAWYVHAEVCVTYLAATNTLSDMRNDPWFTRGWTLQELLAPRQIKFYSMNWNQLSADSDNDKNNPGIQAEIEFATTITSCELRNIQGAPISRRMQLAAKRQVTRGEDSAYCLMGIFDVSISTAYGEGADRAFFRLVEEILRSTKDVSDIFNWAGERDSSTRQPTSSLFPSRPSDYLHRSERLRPWRLTQPLTLTHLGLRTPILLMPAVPLPRESVLPYPPPIGDYHAAVKVSVAPEWRSLRGDLSENYLLLDKRISRPEAMQKVRTGVKIVKMMLVFGTLNVEEQGTNICVPKTCLAVLLAQEVGLTASSACEKVYTEKPIVFDLEKTRNNSNGDRDKTYYQIELVQLKNHGMKLCILYL